MNGLLSYPETRPNAFSLGEVFCEEVVVFLVEFLAEGVLELLFTI